MTADRFERALYASVGLHAFVLACVFLRTVVVPDQPITIRNAIRVDMVGLPDKLPDVPKAELPPAPKPEPAKPAEPAPKPEPVAKPTPAPPPPKAPTVPTKNIAKNQKDALAKLKRANALQEIEQEVAKQKAAAAAAAAKSAPIKGHQVTEGNALTGLERLDYDRYFDEVKNKIFANYNLPQWLADAHLKATIVVLIDERGLVTRKTVRRSSGNDVFDAKALEAVDASSPFPPPPARLRGALSTNGIVFNFPEQ